MRIGLVKLGLAGLLAGMGTMASAGPPLYTATLETAPADGKLILHDIAWRCESGRCVAARNGRSTDATICSSVARALGKVTTFEVGDAAFDAAAQEKCNLRARS